MFAYCLDCWKNKKDEFKCEKCIECNYIIVKKIAFLTNQLRTKNEKYKEVYYNCRCNYSL